MGCSGSKVEKVITLSPNRNMTLVNVISKDVVVSKPESNTELIIVNEDNNNNKEPAVDKLILQTKTVDVLPKREEPQVIVENNKVVSKPESNTQLIKEVAEIEITPKKNESIYVIEKTNSINRKKVILERIREIMKENEIPEGMIKILILETLIINKFEYSFFELEESVKFSLLKSSTDINWNRKPYSKLAKDIDEYFNLSNSQLYYGFDWGCNLLQYEKNYLDFNLKKSNKDGSFQEFKFSPNNNKNVGKSKIIMFIDPSDVLAIQKLKQIYTEIDTDQLDLIPIIAQKVTGKKDATLNKENFMRMGFEDIDLYFMSINKKEDTEKSDKFDKFISLSSNDNKKEVKSLCFLMDNEGHIRYSGPAEHLPINNINLNINYNKLEYKKLKLDLINYIESCNKNLLLAQSLTKGFVKLTRAQIYSSSYKKPRVFIEPLQISLSESKDTTITVIENFQLISKNHSLTSYPEYKVEDMALAVINHIKKFKSENEDEKINYTIISEVKKKINKITSRFEGKLLNSKIKSTDIILNFNINKKDNFTSYLDALGILRTIPYLNKINYISIQPLNESSFTSTLNLSDPAEGSNIEINLEDEKPKMILVFGYNKNEEEREDLKIKLKLIYENLSEELMENIKLITIFKGESIDDAADLLAEEIFNPENNNKIYLLNSSNNCLPLSFDNYQVENSSSQLICFLLDCDNTVRYVGNTEEIDLGKTLSNFIEGKTIVENTQTLLTKEYMKSNFKIEFKKFLSLIEELSSSELHQHYKPIIEFSFHKRCKFEDDDLTEVIYTNLKIKIVCKTGSQFIDNIKIQKYFEKFKNKYKGIVKIIQIKTSNVELPFLSGKGELKCSSCDSALNSCLSHTQNKQYDFFFNQDLESVICPQCESKINIEYNETNLINFKYLDRENQNIHKEILEDVYTSNIKSGNYLNNIDSPCCSLCASELKGVRVIWMSCIHLNHIDSSDGVIDYISVLICDECYMNISERSFNNQRNRYNLKLIGIDPKNIIMRKCILPDFSAF